MEFTGLFYRNVILAVQIVNELTPGYARGFVTPPLATAEERHEAALRAIPVDHDHHSVYHLDEAEADELFRLATQLRQVFEATTMDEAAALVSRLLTAYRAVPELIRGGDGRWQLHFHSAFAGPAAARAAGCATAFAILIENDQLSRMGVCEARKCDRVFLDSSRNGRKRYCTTACSNRAKAAQFRARQLEPAPA